MRYFRRIIKVTAEDSPNVRYARAELAAGLEPSNKILVPGVLPWNDYVRRREMWDKVKQCIGLDAEFYEGAEVLLYPPDWLNKAEMYWREIEFKSQKALSIGIDPAEGGDKTSMAVIGEYGLMELRAKKTPNTAVIGREAIAIGREYDVRPENWIFDRGGGGTQIADDLRSMGYDVRTVAFGSPVKQEIRRIKATIAERKDVDEEKYVYKNVRAQMYGLLRLYLDPARGFGFSLNPEYTELRRQMSLIPLLYDKEGQMYIPPKRKKNPESTEITLQEILGCSPDELDSVVLGVYGRENKRKLVTVGGF